ncbi:YybH family protein [Actinomadura fibrosa]|uniref:YybH family protein n=1 Tax=Actinomadura fibrosa TaxID=111802 RepID=A0ABW2XHC0_9ACTN|nr:nuclear transport factor 2 family protein [Actinomadura fibrosa]
MTLSTHREADEIEIRQQIDAIVGAVGSKDLEGLKRVYTPEIVSFDIDPPLQHLGIEAKARNWANVFTVFETVTYQVRDLTLTVGEDVAFGHAFARLSGTLRNGTATDGMWVRVTYGLRKIDSTWLIAHDQVSVPLDIASGKGVTDLHP